MTPRGTATLLLPAAGCSIVTRAWRLAVKCCIRGVVVALVVGAWLVGAATLLGIPTAIGLSLLLAATLIVFALTSAWRMARGLADFAETVPAEAEVSASAHGQARLSWPSLNLAVRGTAGVLKEPSLEVEAAGQPLTGSVEEAEGLAEEALGSLGVRASA